MLLHQQSMLQSLKYTHTQFPSLSLSTSKHAVLTSTQRSMGANLTHTPDSKLPLLIKLIELNQAEGDSMK